MLDLIDKILLLVGCCIIYYFHYDSTYILVPIIIVVIISCLNTIKDDPHFSQVTVLTYILICLIYPNLLFFLPIIFYDILFTSTWRTAYLAIIPYISHVHILKLEGLLYHVLLIVIVIIAKNKTSTINKQNEEYKRLRDSSKEISLLLEDKNRTLLEKQDYEVNLARLNERNRISKEIHDNIGHLLSRSLIQIGALLTIAKEPLMKDSLNSLKVSISEGMDSIRSSIHDMHDESIDLYTNLETLINEFKFCKVSLQYDVNNVPTLKLKYCIIAIVKESLGNIMKHSNATKVHIRLLEHPIMYQLIISDNGNISDSTKNKIKQINNSITSSDGMGLQNIIERTKGFGGNYNITADKGFRIFITFPKKEK